MVVMNPPFGALAAGTKDHSPKPIRKARTIFWRYLLSVASDCCAGWAHWRHHVAHLLLSCPASRNGVKRWCLGIARPEVMADLGLWRDGRRDG